MGAYALIVVTVLYGVTAWDFFSKGDPALGWAFVCYAGANLGFIAAAMRS